MLLRAIPKYDVLLEMSGRYPDLDPSAIQCCLTLRRVADDLEAAMNRHFAAHGVSHGRFTLMLMLDGGGLSPTELAERIGVTRATISGLLRGLCRDGLVTRRPDPADLRAATAHLTDAGAAQLRAMLPDHFRRLAGVVGGLSPEERARLVALLRKVDAGLPALDHGQ